jgi:hypothetical protein
MSGRIGTWMMPASSYSTGSSVVMIFSETSFTAFRQA